MNYLDKRVEEINQKLKVDSVEAGMKKLEMMKNGAKQSKGVQGK